MNCQILATKIQIILEYDAINTINLLFTRLAKGIYLNNDDLFCIFAAEM
jgi:hypothetical protein